jgi:LysR family transcriptional regulator, transcriptional activator of nhaA
MDALNYHHLRYFWAVAKEGSISRAAAKLNVSQPSISEQIRELEVSFDEKLFRREGRGLALTDAGKIAFSYAEQIFALGRELSNAVRLGPEAMSLRLYVGVMDSLPKLVTNEILSPIFLLPQTMHVICREGKLRDLLAQLAAHRLDVVLSDESAPCIANCKTYSHSLGETGTVFCAEKKLGLRLRRGFPQSLHGAPALLPTENTALRRALNTWFHEHQIEPCVVAEFDDPALMKVMAAEGRGFIAVPAVSLADAVSCYNYQVVGRADACRIRFYAITGERMNEHPAVTQMTTDARVMFRC